MADDKLWYGDVVQLKSGSPSMTIVGFKNPSGWSMVRHANCVWFEGTVQKYEDYPVAALKKVPEEP